MVRILHVAVIFGAVLGSPAFAAGAPQVTVTISGKQPQEVHAELVKASNRVCSEISNYGSLDIYGTDRLDCVHDTLGQAMRTVKKMQATRGMFAQNTARQNSRE